jgi:hypothetical protein
MSELDRRITNELVKADEVVASQSGSPGLEVKNMMDLVIQQNARQMRKIRWFVWGWHLFFLAAVLIGVSMVLWPVNSNESAAGLFVSMGAFAGFVVIKVAYWLACMRLRLETKFKEIEVRIAELKEMVRGEKR